nr:MAG TPA: replisome organizer protein [Caudoviricetes sp.]
MKLLRRLPGGEEHTIIYLKLMLASLQDDGKIFFEGLADSLAEEMALIIDEDAEAVRMTLMFLEQKKLLTTSDNFAYKLEQVPEMIGSETASTRRSRKHRSTQKALQCNTDATKCNGEIEIEIEIDIEAEVEKEKKNEIPTTTPLGEFNQLILENFGKQPSPLQVDEMRYLVEEHKMEVLRLAVKEAVDNGKPYFAYLNGILNRWKHDGLTTAELVRNRVKPRKKSGKVTMLDDGYDPKLGI